MRPHIGLVWRPRIRPDIRRTQGAPRRIHGGRTDRVPGPAAEDGISPAQARVLLGMTTWQRGGGELGTYIRSKVEPYPHGGLPEFRPRRAAMVCYGAERGSVRMERNELTRWDPHGGMSLRRVFERDQLRERAVRRRWAERWPN